jgi:hypothetical protein
MDFGVRILTAAHVVISLIAIVSGAVVSYGFLAVCRAHGSAWAWLNRCRS